MDAFGFRSITDLTDDASKLPLTGPSAKEWTKEPAHPLILFATCENAVGLQSKTPFSNDDVRQAVYWGLLLAPPAGVSFTAKGVVNWEQASYLVKFMNSIEFWRLRPQPQIVAAQPGTTSPRRYIAAAGTDAKDLVLVYVPEDRTVEILLDALPPSPNVSWFNPRTGETSPAVAVVGGRTCQFPTSDPGDWLLVMKSGK